MAQTGFPWATQSSIREPSYVDEKAADQPSHPDAITQSPPAPLADTTNKHYILPFQPLGARRSHAGSMSHGKRRAGSLKSKGGAVRPAVPGVVTVGGGREGASHAPVRTIPPWVQDADENDLAEFEREDPSAPTAAHLAQHNHTPSTLNRPLLNGAQGKQELHLTSTGRLRPERTSRWISFARASAYPRENFNSEKVDPEWFDQNFTDYSKPWLAGHDDEDDDDDSSNRYHAYRRKKRVWYRRIQTAMFRNPFVPLAFRVTIIIFACVAIALGSDIYNQTGHILHCITMTERTAECRDLVGTVNRTYYRDPSALMAIIVDAIAVAYSLYITYDEYFSKPLGLRSARAKVRLTLLDMVFIIFQSANLSLAYEALAVDAGACKLGSTPLTSIRFDSICSKSKALGAVLTVSLVAWVLTFSVSVLRLVERMG